MSSRIAHMVYFSLVDNTPAQVDHLIAQCIQYLDGHPGLEYFAVGRLNQELQRDVNDREFEVSLHTVFADRAAHDAYQTDSRHQEFIDNNRANWKRVRVFDSNLA